MLSDLIKFSVGIPVLLMECALSGTLLADDVDLETVRFKLTAERQALVMPLEALSEQYTSALLRLKETATQAGDLSKRLLLEAEIARLSREPEGSFGGGGFSELEKVRAIYEERRTTLLKAAEGKLETMLTAYRARCVALQQKLTKEESIEEAIEARDLANALEDELERLREAQEETKEGKVFPQKAMSLVLEWETLFDGMLNEASGESLDFIGSTTVGSIGAVVALNELPSTFSVTGEIHVTGQYPGIVLAYDAKNRPFAIACSVNDGTEIETWERGDRVKTTRHNLAWGRGVWETLEITRNEEGWWIGVGGTRQLVPLPRTLRGGRFGFMAFGPGQLKLRDLVIAAQPGAK